jgi:6-pyruvoyltetrahydropterin/6-carboxytetrahydropterin synthase
MITCTKRYTDIPFAHRAPKHDGHCRLLHGHNWSFEVTFVAKEVDGNGFVMDFGKLKELKEVFDRTFDHKLLINGSDPLLQDIQEWLQMMDINNVVEVPDCSCEGIAKLVWQLSNAAVVKQTDGRVRVRKVIVYEDTKNWATYAPISVTPS